MKTITIITILLFSTIAFAGTLTWKLPPDQDGAVLHLGERVCLESPVWGAEQTAGNVVCMLAEEQIPVGSATSWELDLEPGWYRVQIQYYSGNPRVYTPRSSAEWIESRPAPAITWQD